MANKVKGHKPAKNPAGSSVADQRLDDLSDRELGRAARQVIEQVLRPGVESGSQDEARVLRYILEELVIAAYFKPPHRGAKWVGDQAIRMVAMVMRRTRAGMSKLRAFEDIGARYILPIDALHARDRCGADSPVDAETVRKTFRRARESLKSLGMLSRVEKLLTVERVHEGLEPRPRYKTQADRELYTLPEPVLPPDFRKRGAPESAPWVPSHFVEQFLYQDARQRVLAQSRPDDKRKKSRKRVP